MATSLSQEHRAEPCLLRMGSQREPAVPLCRLSLPPWDGFLPDAIPCNCTSFPDLFRVCVAKCRSQGLESFVPKSPACCLFLEAGPTPQFR